MSDPGLCSISALSSYASGILAGNFSAAQPVKESELWTSLQDKIAKYVNDNGGTAIKRPSYSDTHDWSAVKTYLGI